MMRQCKSALVFLLSMCMGLNCLPANVWASGQAVTLAEDDIASGKSGNIRWRIDSDGTLYLSGSGDYKLTEDEYDAYYIEPDYEFADEDDYTWLSYSSSIHAVDLSDLDASSMTSMEGMFYDCYNLEYVDLSGLDTHNVKTMRNMFSECYDLEEINMKGVDTSHVTDMVGMFESCYSLKTINNNNLDTSKLTDIRCMFEYCEELSLEITFSNRIDEYEECFEGAASSDNALILVNYSGSCSRNLAEEIVATKTGGNHVYLYGEPMTDDPDDPGPTDSDDIAYGKDGNINWRISKDGTLYLSGYGDYEDSYPDWYFYNEEILAVDMTDLDSSSMTSTRNMFAACWNLECIDFSNFDTSHIKNVSGMFYLCSSLSTEITFSGDLTDWSYCFEGAATHEDSKVVFHYTGKDKEAITKSLLDTCWSDSHVYSVDDKGNLISRSYEGTDGNLTWSLDSYGKLTIYCDGEPPFDWPWGDFGIRDKVRTAEVHIKNVTDITYLFDGCKNLTAVDFSDSDTSCVKRAFYMFYGCKSLKSFDFSQFDTSSLEDMAGMFSYCESLEKIDLSKNNTSNVRWIDRLFTGCSSLKEVNLSGVDLSNTSSIYNMFSGCSSLKTVSTKNCRWGSYKETSSMFNDCSSLTSLDLNAMDFSQTCSAALMFANCKNLKDLKIDKWNTVNMYNCHRMFYGCKNVVAEITFSGNFVKPGAKATAVPADDDGSGSYYYVDYSECFKDAATAADAGIIVNYDNLCTLAIVQDILGTRSENSNVFAVGVPETEELDKGRITLSKTSYVYDGKAKKPSVTVKSSKNVKLTKGTDYTVSYSSNKKVGTAKVKITGMGNYTGTISKTFKINPVATSITKLTKGTKSFTVKWTKKTEEVTGYQIQYGLKKDFSDAKTAKITSAKTTSKTVKSLKAKKTYYVRIRTYKTVSKKDYYSKWSDAKTVKTK